MSCAICSGPKEFKTNTYCAICREFYIHISNNRKAKFPSTTIAKALQTLTKTFCESHYLNGSL